MRNSNQLPIDRVSGYSIKQLEIALIGTFEWCQWKTKIEYSFDNPTKGYLNELFGNWEHCGCSTSTNIPK